MGHELGIFNSYARRLTCLRVKVVLLVKSLKETPSCRLRFRAEERSMDSFSKSLDGSGGEAEIAAAPTLKQFLNTRTQKLASRVSERTPQAAKAYI